IDRIVAASPPLGYRQRTRQQARAGRLGHHAWRSQEVVDVRRCLLLAEPLDEAIQAARAWLPAEGELRAQLGSDGQIALSCGASRRGPAAVDLAEPGEAPFLGAAEGFTQVGPD